MKKIIDMSLYQEVRLFSSVRQREEVENKAELYSIIKTLQELEKAYIKVTHYIETENLRLSVYKEFSNFSDQNPHIQEIFFYFLGLKAFSGLKYF